MKIYIFEDEGYQNFLPLTYFRPVYDLRCGALSLKEKIEKYLKNKVTGLHTRNELSGVTKESYPKKDINNFPTDYSLFINGRIIADKNFFKEIKFEKSIDQLFISGDTIVAAYLTPQTLESMKKYWLENPFPLFQVPNFKNILIHNINAQVANYPWDLITFNGDEIGNDFFLLAKEMKGKTILGKIHKGVHLLNRQNIIMDRESEIYPGAVLDASNGPIIIGANVLIMANSVITGPVYIGDDSIIKVGAKIYSNTSIGDSCKVGGEVDSTIIQSHSNKQHDGYLGHAYVGSWVNIGADTNNSDLKNNYSPIKVTINGKLINTGLIHFGTILGDHSKTGINMMFDTGSVVGVYCNLYGAGLPPRYIPSFTRGSGSGPLKTNSFEMSIDTAKIVMARRNVQLTKEYEELVKIVFDDTQTERKQAGIL
ncbi:MAG: putative sugar nucleotidyl transferase [Bacteroidota bacterium]|nr:putative sugar nucleotidyl transferase [Bacteroidota bacterium]